MRVLLVSWEYPPLVVGGLGRHVDALAHELAAAGHDVRVLTRGDGAIASDETRDGVRVRRAAQDPLAIEFTVEMLLGWSQASEHAMLRTGLTWLRRWKPDVIHAHDWLVAQTAITLSELTGAPLVTTIHATEWGRHLGHLPSPLSRAIDSIERWLVQRSAGVITCSSAIRDDVLGRFSVSSSIVDVVPNGVHPERWAVSGAGRVTQRARHPGSPLLVYAGRLVHEKGVQTLLDALPLLRTDFPELQLVVAGTGIYAEALRAHARRRRVARHVDWLGFVPDGALAPVLAAASVVVVPSHYEPFGIVALEAAATRVPTVVARTGGLSDLVEAGVATASCAPRDVAGLVVAVHAVLDDPASTAGAVRRAHRIVTRDYSWPSVAAQTVAIYATHLGS